MAIGRRRSAQDCRVADGVVYVAVVVVVTVVVAVVAVTVLYLCIYNII